MALRIHFFVKDPDYLDPSAGDSVVNQMMFDMELSVALPDRIAIDPEPGVFGQDGNAFIQLVEVCIGLLGSSLLERIVPDTDQIFFGEYLLMDLKHWTRLFLPFVWPYA